MFVNFDNKHKKKFKKLFMEFCMAYVYPAIISNESIDTTYVKIGSVVKTLRLNIQTLNT